LYYLQGILITTISTYTDSSIGYDYPEYALVIGNILAFGPCSLIAVVAVVQLVKEKGTLCQVIC
jgi:hypothetical protein